MKISAPEKLLDAQAQLGEGPYWDDTRQRLGWVDILAGRLHEYDPATGQDQFIELGQPVGCAAPCQSGRLILGMKEGLAFLSRTAQDAPPPGQDTVALNWIARPEPHLPNNRFNDGKCGPDGRFLAGTMDMGEKNPSGALYSLTPGGTLQTLRREVRISNGLTWSPDYQTLYYIDTLTSQVLAYDYDISSGAIANPRVAVQVPKKLGWPDGMTADLQGRLWVALWGGAAITIWNAGTGRLIETIRFPAKNVTSCAFGGPEQDTLYVTSARIGLGWLDLLRYPDSGSLFRVRTNVQGLPTFQFGD
jgi:sugar lactone lactonase YvrE